MHSLKDAQLIRSKTLPGAGGSASTNSIDLLAVRQEECHFEVEVTLPALPNLAADKSVTITLEDSADTLSFAAIPGLAPLKLTGAVGGGGSAASQRLRLPSVARRFLRATATVEASGGNNTAVSFSLGLVF
jgi:hypothetical protein